MTRRGVPFASVPTRCPSCRPLAVKVTRPDGSKTGWSPEATFVGFLRTQPFEGYKRAPAICPACGSTLIEVRNDT